MFYPGDASEDTQFMNRLERGCYFDLLKAQKKFGRFTLDQIKKVLGNDFEICWPALKICLSYEEHMYFISWVDDSIRKRKEYSESRSINRKNTKEQKSNELQKTYVEDMKNISTTHDNHMVNENENTSNVLNAETGKLPILSRMQEIYLTENTRYHKTQDDMPAYLGFAKMIAEILGHDGNIAYLLEDEVLTVMSRWRQWSIHIAGSIKFQNKSLSDLYRWKRTEIANEMNAIKIQLNAETKNGIPLESAVERRHREMREEDERLHGKM